MEYPVVLIAALFHAIWNSMIKGSGDRLMTLAAIRATGLFFGVFVVILLPPLTVEAVPYLLTAAVIHFLYFWLLLNTYRVGDFSQVYPISRGAAPLMVVILGAAFAGEWLSPLQVLATVIISLGILSLSFAGKAPAPVPAGYALATAVSIAGYTVVSGMGVRIAGSFLVYAGWLETLCGAGVLIFAAARRKGPALDYARQNWRRGIIAGMLSVSAFAAALWAMKTAPMAPVAAIRETSIVFAAVIGALLMKEGHARCRISMACLVAVGVLILIIR